MSHRSSEESASGLLPSVILDVLFGAGIVLTLLTALYLCRHPGISLFYASGIVACYALLALIAGAGITSTRSSTYGTPLLNQYKKLSLYWIALNVVVMLAVGFILYSGGKAAVPSWISWLLSACGIILMLASLGLLRGLSSAMRRQRRYPRLMGCAFLLIGPEHETERLFNGFSNRETRGLFLSRFEPTGNAQSDARDVQTIIENEFIEKAVFLEPASAPGLVERCKKQGIEVWTPPAGSPPGLPLCQYRIERPTPPGTLVLFAFNRLLSLVMILVSLPFWIAAAIGIRLADKGPVFYQQARSGLYGKHFGMWKFRTMYTDADKRLDEVKAQYGNDMAGPIFKLKNDPRIFTFGKFLRTFSIDELPQLINTLQGDMNIVGPRPLPVYETESFDNFEQRKRLCVLPGLTCYWQIEGRSNITDFNELVSLDYKYIDHRSLWLDIRLILKTVPAVLMAKGAE